MEKRQDGISLTRRVQKECEELVGQNCTRHMVFYLGFSILTILASPPPFSHQKGARIRMLISPQKNKWYNDLVAEISFLIGFLAI